jgi:hypothetical protein
MTFDEAASVFVLVMAALLLGWRYRPRVFLGRLGATIRHVARLFIMSRPMQERPHASDTDAVHVPVPSTDTSADTEEDWEMPRVGRRLSDGEIIAMLATQKGVDGARYRFSANQIYELVKGPRAAVLAQIRAVRESPPAAPQVREHQERLGQLAAAHED